MYPSKFRLISIHTTSLQYKHTCNREHAARLCMEAVYCVDFVPLALDRGVDPVPLDAVRWN